MLETFIFNFGHIIHIFRDYETSQLAISRGPSATCPGGIPADRHLLVEDSITFNFEKDILLIEVCLFFFY